MTQTIKIRRGLTIVLAGEAEKVLSKTAAGGTYALKPDDFLALVPRLLVQEGTEVLAGTPLFVDKYRPEVQYASPVSGTVTAIVRGEKRRLLEVVITPSATQEYVQHTLPAPETMSRQEVIASMLGAGVWPFIKQRPYGIVANPDDEPKAIFISGFHSAPLAPDTDYLLTGEGVAFQKGIDVLRRLCSKIYLGVNGQLAATSILRKVRGVDRRTFDGPHPAGNVGVQIHHVCPINKGEKVWTIDPQHIVSLGRLFLKGVYDVSKVIALTGSEVRKPRYYRMVAGASLAGLQEHIDTRHHPRYISGNPLTGVNVGAAGHLGFYDSQVTVIPEGNCCEMLGWANPLRLKKFSASRSYLSWLFPRRAYTLNSNLNGGQRTFVVNGEYEKVLPMGIYPVYLLKAILAEDLDRMEQLGIYEVIEEDLALCEFVCTSKMPVQDILRQGIRLMIKEM